MLINKKQKGFTLIELMVIAPIVIIAVVGTIALLINLIADNAVTNAENSASAEVQSALNEIQNSLSSAQGFRGTPGPSPIADSTQNSNYSTDAPTSASPFNRMYIIGQTYDQISINSKIEPAFLTTPNSCSSANRVDNDVRSTNTVYFAQKTSASKTELKRRILTAPSPNICGTSGASVTTGIPPSCEAGNPSPCDSDDVLVRDVVKFAVTYYSGPTAIATDPTTATSAKIDLVIKKSIGGKDITYRGSTRFDLLNQ